MTAVQLPASQYTAYDMQGAIVASRSTRAHLLAEESEQGPGICVVLRTGEELGNTDGIGVSLTLTDEQLFELGYVPAEPIAEQVSAIVELLQGMPDEVVGEFDDPFFDDEGEPRDFAYCKARGMIDPATHGNGDDLEIFCTFVDGWVPTSSHTTTSSCVDKRAVKLP